MNQPSGFSDQPPLPAQDDEIVPARRMFIYESGWRVGVKTGSTRELCYMIAPGQDFYHRLLDGEMFLVRDGERLCLSCASRRGLISYGPRQLRDSIVSVPADLDTVPLELDWRDAKRSNG
jgi:hypothetical protein